MVAACEYSYRSHSRAQSKSCVHAFCSSCAQLSKASASRNCQAHRMRVSSAVALWLRRKPRDFIKVLGIWAVYSPGKLQPLEASSFTAYLP